MADLKACLQRLQQNLNILEERQAKHGGNEPLELLNQIDDHIAAIILTELAMAGQLSEADWREALRPLFVDIRDRSRASEASSVTMGDVFGDLVGNIIAGRDITAGGDIVTGFKIEAHKYTYNYYQSQPPDPIYNPEDLDAPLPDIFPPAQHLIGRQREQTQLLERYRQLTHDKQGRFVFITGRPGYGRLALARSLLQAAQADETPVLVARFKPTNRLTLAQAEILWRDDPFIGPALQQYGDRVTAFWPSAVHLGGLSWQALVAQIARHLEYTPKPKALGVVDRPEAIRTLLRLLVRHRPGLLLMENLDYAPDYWLDLLKYLSPEISSELPCLVVATAEARQPLANFPKEYWTDTLHLAHTLAKAAQADTLWLGALSAAEIKVYLSPAERDLPRHLHDLTGGLPQLVESLWQEWLDVEAVSRDPSGIWVAAADSEWSVYGDTRDRAYDLLTDCFPDKSPYSQTQVEQMLTCAALEGYTFTAQAVARALGFDADDLQDFWDQHLLETEEYYGLLVDAGFASIPDVGGSRNLNLYRFARPYLWHVWAKYPARPPRQIAADLAGALEAVYYPTTDKVGHVLARLLEMSGQPEKAGPYRRRRQTALNLESLRWQVALLADLASDDFEKYRLFDMRLKLSGELYKAGRYDEGYRQGRAARRQAKKWGDALRQAAAMNVAGLNLMARGRYTCARPYYERALAIREKVLGPEHPNTATSLNNLGLLLHGQGEYEAARPYYERALAIREKVLGPEHPNTATSLNNLGGLLSRQGEYEAARPYYERALAICEKVLGPEHPDTASSLNNLGGLLRGQGEYEAARPYYERALAICEKVLGPEHPNTATSLNNLGFLLDRQGEYEAARPYYERALAICEKVLGPEHPDTQIVRGNLAALDDQEDER